MSKDMDPGFDPEELYPSEADAYEALQEYNRLKQLSASRKRHVIRTKEELDTAAKKFIDDFKDEGLSNIAPISQTTSSDMGA